MPIILPGSMQLGPRGSSSPATMAAFLSSIGKSSWYGGFLQGQGLVANSDGSGGAVSSGGAVGCWATSQSAGGFSAKWIQATSASRPGYSTSLSGLGPVVYGNGSSWSLYLDSATALNRDCTILISLETTAASGYLFTQNGDQWSWYISGNSDPQLYYSTTEVGSALAQAHRNDTLSGAAAWQRARRVAISSGASTSRYGSPMRILGGASGYFTGSRFAEIWVTEKLTSLECTKALTYLP